jgi:demethylmenaquinone methyltransferase/2-methoxy-6-polyprenyl-1,4-benzoquinol methylase
VVAADFSLPMLALAGRKLGSRPVVRIAADALRLPFRDDIFDAVGIAFSLRNVESVPALLTEMKRVVRPGGAVMTLEFSRPPNWFFRALYFLYLRQLLPRIGGLVSPGAYRYLADSIRAFPGPGQLARLFRQAGLEEVRWRVLSGGIVAIHVGRKPGPN